MKKLFSVLFVSIFLIGCGEESYTVEQLKKDPELMDEINKECKEIAEESKEKMLETPKCKVLMQTINSIVQDSFNKAGKIANEALEQTNIEIKKSFDEAEDTVHDALEETNTQLDKTFEETNKIIEDATKGIGNYGFEYPEE